MKVSKLREGTNCGHCSTAGVNWRGEGLLYVVHHRELNAGKFGITGETKKFHRIEQWADAGFGMPYTLPFATYHDSHRVEQALRRHLRDELGIPAYLSKRQMPDGWTETFDADQISTSDVFGIALRLKVEDERGQHPA